ncbi:hypothetical protein QFZ70_000286 [Arthrobacter sp. V1I9]|uniref:hypothetical protein n=1 Tax=Arthrobacter sp. V1I9 TaxID=3042275 RepID=UPI0027935AF3|nr:hypothetical protein [Arthrobacter sp. V1I9]MDQ0867813.1 hypothetical protein [Arthrobacter sp. V1I9]
MPALGAGRFRRDARLAMELDEIVEDDEDAVLHPTVSAGQVPGDGSTPALRPQPN